MYEDLLRKEVENYFDHKINNAGDCKRLSEDIYRITEQRLSDQTLRRFWQLIPAKSNIKTATKDLLCQYIGFKNFGDFIQKRSQQSIASPSINFDLVVRMFEQNKVDDNEYHLWHEGFAQVLVELIFSDQYLFEVFVNKLHQNKYAMKFVMAEYFYYHLLSNGWYLRGLQRFTSHSKVLHHQVYYLSMELVKCMLQNNPNAMPSLLSDTFSKMGDLKKQPNIPFPLVGSLFGLAIFYYATQKNDTKIGELIQEVDAIYNRFEKIIFETFFTTDAMIRTLVEILLWAGCYEEAYYFFKKYGLKVRYDKKINKTIQQLQLIQNLIVAVNAQDRKSAGKLLMHIDIHCIRFDLKPIYTTLFMLCELALFKPTSKQKIAQHIAKIEEDCTLYHFIILKQQIPKYQKLIGKM